MPEWLIYSLTATLFYGIMNFLYKMSAERKYINPAIVLTAAATVVVSSAVTLIVSGTGFSRFPPAL
ncbi:hypothetical protein KJ865_12945, partial [Myxococcota bacterium]|nr:hypothetical protein [Myxococcota bacterium]